MVRIIETRLESTETEVEDIAIEVANDMNSIFDQLGKLENGLQVRVKNYSYFL